MTRCYVGSLHQKGTGEKEGPTQWEGRVGRPRVGVALDLGPLLSQNFLPWCLFMVLAAFHILMKPNDPVSNLNPSP